LEECLAARRVWAILGLAEVSVLGHRLGAGTDVELFVDASDVGIDGGDTDVQAFGNLFI
jgi:hypothetical protein